MATDTVVRAHIDGREKAAATGVLDDMGLSVPDAIRMLLVRIAREKAFPFEARIPNAATAAARAELESGRAKRFRHVSALIAEVNEQTQGA